MGTDVKRITDKSIYKDIFAKYFYGHNIFMKTSTLNIQVDSFTFVEGKILVTVNHQLAEEENPVFYVRIKEDVYFVHAKLLSCDKGNNFVFGTLDIQIMKIPRKEERVVISSDNTRSNETVFVSNIVSDFAIKDDLSFHKRKVEFLKDEIVKKTISNYSKIKIFLFNEKQNDVRMEYFKNERIPYIVHDINNDEDLKKSTFGIYYMTHIKTSDAYDDSDKFMSEISVPLLFRYSLPFGYIEVTSDAELTNEDFIALKKLGMSISTIFTNDKQLIRGSDDKFNIADLSEKGLSLYFTERTLIKYFKDGSYVVCTLYLPNKKQAGLFCVVRNISILKNNVYRIGCEIIDMDSIGEVHYSEYLESRK